MQFKQPASMAKPKEIGRGKAIFLRLFGRLEQARQMQQEAKAEYTAFQSAAFWASKGNLLEAGDMLLAAAEKLEAGRKRGADLSQAQAGLLWQAIEYYQLDFASLA